MEEPFQFSRPADKEEARLEQLAGLVAFTVLGNTERGMLRKMAVSGEPLDLVMQGLLAYSDQARYAISKMDLEDEAHLAHALRLTRERKYIDFTIRLFERILSPLPETTND